MASTSMARFLQLTTSTFANRQKSSVATDSLSPCRSMPPLPKTAPDLTWFHQEATASEGSRSSSTARPECSCTLDSRLDMGVTFLRCDAGRQFNLAQGKKRVKYYFTGRCSFSEPAAEHSSNRGATLAPTLSFHSCTVKEKISTTNSSRLRITACF